MAGPYYVRSTDGDDASDGLSWANAKATLAGAFAVMAAGERVWVSQAHAETAAAMYTLTSPGTAASPCQILCGNDAAEPPTALATTATITSTNNNAGRSFLFAGFAYSYGVQYLVSGGSAGAIRFQSASPWWWRIEAGKLGTRGTLVAGLNATTADDQLLELINTTIDFIIATAGIEVRCPFRWTATASAIAGATLPTTLFLTPSTGNAGYATIFGVDLSALGSGKNLVDAGQANFGDYLFQNCKLGSSVAIVTGTVAGQGATTVEVVNCDSADTNYRYAKHVYQGSITQETTIVRTGGASDGTTAFSRKMVSGANAKFYSPLEGPWVYFWNETIGAVTVSFETVTDNVTLTDAEAWVEVEHLGTSGFPLSLIEQDRAADILATPANQTTSSETWTTTGLTTPVKQTLSESVTPAEIGWIRARVILAKASTTVYVCPKILSTSAAQYMTPDGSIVNAPAAGGGAARGGHIIAGGM